MNKLTTSLAQQDSLSFEPDSAENPVSIYCSHFVSCCPYSCVQQYPTSRHKANSLWVSGPVRSDAGPQASSRLWAHATPATKESEPQHPTVAQCQRGTI